MPSRRRKAADTAFATCRYHQSAICRLRNCRTSSGRSIASSGSAGSDRASLSGTLKAGGRISISRSPKSIRRACGFSIAGAISPASKPSPADTRPITGRPSSRHAPKDAAAGPRDFPTWRANVLSARPRTSTARSCGRPSRTDAQPFVRNWIGKDSESRTATRGRSLLPPLVHSSPQPAERLVSAAPSS